MTAVTAHTSDFVEHPSRAVDRPWLARYPACVDAHVAIPEAPAWSLLRQAADRCGSRAAFRYYRETTTYDESHRDALRIADVLSRNGIEPGDRVGLLLPNVPEYASALNGIWMAGGTAVALSPLMVPEEVSSLLEATDCRVVVALDMLAPLLRNAPQPPRRVLYTTINDRLPHVLRAGYALARWHRLGWRNPGRLPGESWLSNELRAAGDGFSPIEVDADEPAYVLPTGGTTGAPKAVTLSHRNLVANALQLKEWAGNREGRDSVLAILPFFHSYGLSTGCLTSVAAGATTVLHHRFVPKIVRKLILEHEPTMFPAVPRLLVAMNQLLRAKPIPRFRVQYVVSGGAALPQSVADEFAERTGATVVEGYGLSEASPVTHVGPLDGSNRPGTIGLPLPNTEARIVDAETGTETLPPGAIGELCVRGPQVMSGYWNDPDRTGEVIRDGWLFTGDLGTMDEDGFFRICDRKKDLVITSGFNVCPADVEAVLDRFPGVRASGVIGVPCEERGEIVTAFVAVEPGTAPNLQALEAFAAEHLAKHKRPRRYEFVQGDLPRNFLGKIVRRELRAKAAPGTAPVAAAN